MFSFLLRPLVYILVISAILNVVLWAMVILLFPATEEAVLHYSIGVGIDFIGASRQIYLLPVIGLIVLFGNTFLGLAIRRTDNRSAWLLWSVIPPVHFILLISYLLLWLVNR